MTKHGEFVNEETFPMFYKLVCSSNPSSIQSSCLNPPIRSGGICGVRRMKMKKRRCNGPIIENCGSGQRQVAEYGKADDDKVHVLTVYDDLESYLAPSTPEIHRVRLPAPCEMRDFLRRRAFSSSNCDGTMNLNPKPCNKKVVETGVSGTGALLGLDLTLSPESLKEPNQVFIEGFEKLLEMKFGIMALRVRHGLDAWSLGSHMVNPFEVLSFVAATSVLNRAYFKMWELIQTFELVPSVSRKQRFLSAHLCEGPGGFIEAVLQYRAQSSMLNEDSREAYNVPDGEILTGDTLTAVNGIGAGWESRSDGSCASTKTSLTGSGAAGRRTPMTDSPTASDALKDLRSNRNLKVTLHTVHALIVGTGSEPGGLDSPCPAAGSRGDEGTLTFISESPRARASMNDPSGPHSSALVSELLQSMEGEMDREDSSSNLDEFGGEIMSCSPGVRKARMDPLSSKLRVSISGSNLHDNSRSFMSGEKTSKQYHDLWFGLTLASTHQCANGGSPPPRMATRRLNEKVVGNSEGHVHYGVDGSGDLTNPANGSAFVEYTLGRSDGQRMDLITADGAFDVSEDFSSQEHRHLNLVFCEVVSALRLQAEGGSFVLKLFDCYTASTLTILFILSSLYRNVEIVRLRTTRICNSERYVVAKGFFGLCPQLEKTLLRLNVEWNTASMRGDKVGVLLLGGFPEQLLQAVMESNTAISAVQIDGINRALQLADVIGENLPSSDSFGRRKWSVSMLRRKLQTQKRMLLNAISLCKELRIPCRSQFSVE